MFLFDHSVNREKKTAMVVRHSVKYMNNSVVLCALIDK